MVFYRATRGLRVLTLLRKEKVAPKATNEMKFLQPQAGFMVFSTNEVRFKGVRARPVGGAGAHAPEEVHLGVRIFFWTILVVLTLSLSFLCILLDSCRPR